MLGNKSGSNGSFPGSTASEAVATPGDGPAAVSARENPRAALDSAIAEYEAQIPAELRGRNLKSLDTRLQSGTLSIADQTHHRIAMAALRAIESLRGALNKPNLDAGALKSTASEFRAAMSKIDRGTLNQAIAGYLALIPENLMDQTVEALAISIMTDHLEVAEENRSRVAIAILHATESLAAARQDPEVDATNVLASVKAAYEATKAQLDKCSLLDEIARYHALLPPDLNERTPLGLQALLSGDNWPVTEQNRIRKAMAAQRAIESLNELLLASSGEDPLDAMAEARSTFERVISDLDKRQADYRKSTLEKGLLHYQSLIPADLQDQSISELQLPILNGSLAVADHVRYRKAIAALRVINHLQAELNSPTGTEPQAAIERAKATYDEASADADEIQGDYRKSTFNRAISGYEAQLPDDLKQQALEDLEIAIKTGELSAQEQTRFRHAIAALHAIAQLQIELESNSLFDPLAARDAVRSTFDAEVALADDYRRACFTSAIADFSKLIPPGFQQRSLKSIDMWLQSGTLSMTEDFRYRSAGALLRAIETLELALQNPTVDADTMIPSVWREYEETKKSIEKATFGLAIARFQAQIPEDLRGRSLSDLESLLQSGTLQASEANRYRIAMTALRAIENLTTARHNAQHIETEYARLKAQFDKASLNEAMAFYRKLIPDDLRQSDLQSLERQLLDGSLSLPDVYWNRVAAGALRAIEGLEHALDKPEADVEHTIQRVRADYEAANAQIEKATVKSAVASYETLIPDDLKDLSIRDLEEIFRRASLPVPEESRRQRALIAKQAVAALAASMDQADLDALAVCHRTQTEYQEAKRQVDQRTLDRTITCFQSLVPRDLEDQTIEGLEEAMKDRTMPLLTNLRYHRAFAALKAIARLMQGLETTSLEEAIDGLESVHAAFDAAMAESDRKQVDYRKSTINNAISRYQMTVRADLRGKSLSDLEAQLFDVNLAVPAQTRYREAIATLRAIEGLKSDLERSLMDDPQPLIQAVRETFDAAIAEANRLQTDFDVQILMAAIARFKIRIPSKCQDQTIETLQSQRVMSGNPEEQTMYHQAIAALRAIGSLEAEIRSRSPAPPQVVIERVQAAYDAELAQLGSRATRDYPSGRVRDPGSST